MECLNLSKCVNKLNMSLPPLTSGRTPLPQKKDEVVIDQTTITLKRAGFKSIKISKNKILETIHNSLFDSSEIAAKTILTQILTRSVYNNLSHTQSSKLAIVIQEMWNQSKSFTPQPPVQSKPSMTVQYRPVSPLTDDSSVASSYSDEVETVTTGSSYDSDHIEPPSISITSTDSVTETVHNKPQDLSSISTGTTTSTMNSQSATSGSTVGQVTPPKEKLEASKQDPKKTQNSDAKQLTKDRKLTKLTNDIKANIKVLTRNSNRLQGRTLEKEKESIDYSVIKNEISNALAAVDLLRQSQSQIKVGKNNHKETFNALLKVLNTHYTNLTTTELQCNGFGDVKNTTLSDEQLSTFYSNVLNYDSTISLKTLDTAIKGLKEFKIIKT